METSTFTPNIAPAQVYLQDFRARMQPFAEQGYLDAQERVRVIGDALQELLPSTASTDYHNAISVLTRCVEDNIRNMQTGKVDLSTCEADANNALRALQQLTGDPQGALSDMVAESVNFKIRRQ